MKKDTTAAVQKNDQQDTTIAGSTSKVSSFLESASRSIRSSVFFFQRHDSTFSVTDEYKYQSSNDLNIWNGAALLTADCLGTGILALPHDIQSVLGLGFGIFFLILQLPINLYAGTILSDAAAYVETKQSRARVVNNNNNNNNNQPEKKSLLEHPRDKIIISPSSSSSGKKISNYQAVSIDVDVEHVDENSLVENNDVFDDDDDENDVDVDDIDEPVHHDTATFDFIGMTAALFYNKSITRLIMVLYYTNIFLVLGNYIVVMSHAVAALVGEEIICIPTAGIVASTLMFSVSQLKTMARLGRTASVISLSALAIVVAQCLYFANFDSPSSVTTTNDNSTTSQNDDDSYESINLLRKWSAMGSVGFAVGSQKLFLNIRHEFADRSKAPQSLGIALAAFGSFYVFIALAAGKNPPGFLFDGIPAHTIHRRLAGFFLWVHVVVSYAINSQAICASMDRIFFYQWGPVRNWPDTRRWMLLTGIMAVTAFFVSNAIPFFKDLVAFIGSLTSVPLTLLLPAVFHRRVQRVPIWLPTSSSLGSYALLLFSTIFMITATLGSIYSILSDWEHHKGGFFSCN